MKKIYLFMLVISLMFVSCGQKKETKPSGKTLSVIVLTQSDIKNKNLGHQSLLGLKSAKKMQKYLNNGDEIVFLVLNIKDKNFTEILKNTMLKNKPVAIVSFLSSDEILGLKNELKHYAIPVILTLATNNNVADIKNSFIQVCIDNHKQSLVAAHYIRDEKFMKHVGIVYEKGSVYSTSLAKEFKEIFKNLGGEIEFFLDMGDKNSFKVLADMHGGKTEMIFSSLNSVLMSKTIKILKDKKWHTEILGADGLYSGILQNNMQDMGMYDGVYVIDHFAYDTYPNKKRMRFEKLLLHEGCKDSSYAFLAYDSYRLIVYALQTCPKYSKECISAVLQDSETIKGISGNFSIVEAKAMREVYIDKIHNAKLEKEVVIY